MATQRRIKVVSLSTGEKLFSPQRREKLNGTWEVWKTALDSNGTPMSFLSQKPAEDLLRAELVVSVDYIPIN